MAKCSWPFVSKDLIRSYLGWIYRYWGSATLFAQMFKECWLYFIQQMSVLRGKKEYPVREIRWIMLQTARWVPLRKKSEAYHSVPMYTRGGKRERRRRSSWFHVGSKPSGAAQPLWTSPEQMSHRGLFRIYSNTATFMMIVTRYPWQFALCQSRLPSCCSQSSWVPFLASEPRPKSAERKFPKTSNPPPRKIRRGRVPKEAWLCRAEAGGKQAVGRMRAASEELLLLGGSGGAWCHRDAFAICFPLSLEPALFQGHRQLSVFISKLLYTRQCEYMSCYWMVP